MDRRQFIGTSLTVGAAALAAGASTAIVPAEAVAAPRDAGSFRVVHLTDFHIQPERDAHKGVTKALAAVHKLDPRPDMILTGGDLIMDALGVPEKRARMQFDLFKQVMGDHTDLPTQYCIGNHDIFGWDVEKGAPEDHPSRGKVMVGEELGFTQTYYAFDHKGWRIYVLDNVQPRGKSTTTSYQGYVDAEQMKWLEADLAAKPAATPAAVICHIPIITVTIFSPHAHRYMGTSYLIPNAAVCEGAHALAELFAKHNVKLNLSGHIHQLDRVEFRGVTFINDGAIAGNWWRGPLVGVYEGFGVVDFYADGSFDHQYVNYGWKAVALEEATSGT